MEIKIHNRARVMRVLALVVFLSLVWAYAQLQWGLPQSIKRTLV